MQKEQRGGEKFKKQPQSSGHLGCPSSPHLFFRKVRSHLLQGQDQFCWSTGPLIDLPFSKGGEKMIMTMTILPLMYSHPPIKDTLPQRSVIASQSQLCLDNPSSNCRVPECAQDRERLPSTCCLERGEFPFVALRAAFSQVSSISAAFPHFKIVLLPQLNVYPQTDTHLQSAAA